MTDDEQVARAEVLSNLGRHHEAEELLRGVLEMSPDSAAALRLLSVVLRARGSVEDGVRAVARAAALVPDDPWVHIEWAQALLDLRMPNEAYRRAVESTRLAPHLWAAHYTVARASRERAAGTWSEAWDALSEALRLDPQQSISHNLAGLMLLERPDRRGARQAFERALELDPQSASALGNLVELNASTWKVRLAARNLRTGLAHDPLSANLQNSYAVVLSVILRRLWFAGIALALIVAVLLFAHAPYPLRAGVAVAFGTAASAVTWLQVKPLPGGMEAWRRVLTSRIGPSYVASVGVLVALWCLALFLGLMPEPFSMAVGNVAVAALRGLGLVMIVSWIASAVRRT